MTETINSWVANTTVAATSTAYMYAAGEVVVTERTTIVPFDMKVYHLSVYCSTFTTGTTTVVTLRKNGSDTALSVTVDANNDGYYRAEWNSINGSNTIISFAAGDTMSFKIVNNASGANLVRLTFMSDSGGTAKIMVCGASDATAVSNSVNSYLSWGSAAPATTEAKRQWMVPRIGVGTSGTCGTVKNFYVNLAGAPGAGSSYTFRIRANGTALAPTITITGGVNTSGSDTSNTDVFAVDDKIAVSSNPTTTPTARQMWYSYEFDPNKDGTFVYPMAQGANTNISNTANNYNTWFTLNWDSTVTVDTAAFIGPMIHLWRTAVNFDTTISVDTAPSAGKSWTFGYYQNGTHRNTAALSGTATTLRNTTAFSIDRYDTYNGYLNSCIASMQPASTPTKFTNAQYGFGLIRTPRKITGMMG